MNGMMLPQAIVACTSQHPPPPSFFSIRLCFPSLVLKLELELSYLGLNVLGILDALLGSSVSLWRRCSRSVM